MMAPLMLVFAGLVYWKIPDRLSREPQLNCFAGVPFLRLGTLAAGVICVAASGSAPGMALCVLLIIAAMALVGLTFRFDRRAADNLFPRGALSVSAPIGLALWILALHGMTQTSVTLFLPLLLQVVHQVSPVVINFLSIVISMGWTIGTFTVSGWSGKRERLALLSGPPNDELARSEEASRIRVSCRSGTFCSKVRRRLHALTSQRYLTLFAATVCHWKFRYRVGSTATERDDVILTVAGASPAGFAG